MKKDTQIGLPQYFIVFAALMVLLVLTVIASFFHFGNLNIVIALAIAFLKAFLVVWIFMHMKVSSRLSQLFIGSTMLFLAIMFVFTWADYQTRRDDTSSNGWNNQVERMDELNSFPVSGPTPRPHSAVPGAGPSER